MNTLVRHQLLILCTAAAVFLIGLGAPKLWDEDEPEYARCTQEMMHRGDMIVPTFNDHLWTDKPVFLYWLIMGSFTLFGQTEFAARLPCALMAIGTALMTYHLGRRLFRPQVGLWAALIVATTASFAVVGRASAPDSPLIFCTTLSLLIYVCGVNPELWSGESFDASGGRSSATALDRFRAVLPRRWGWFLAMYAPMGVAVLDKGPVGVLLPVASIGIWVLIAGAVKKAPAAAVIVPTPKSNRNQSDEVTETVGMRLAQYARRAARQLKTMATDFPAATWAMRPVTLTAIVLTIAAPWYVAVGIMTSGEWTTEFFFHHNVHRFLHPMEQHAGSLLYYPIATMIGFFPWALTLVLGLITVVRRVRRGERHSRSTVFALCWILTWFIVFTFSASKLSHYVAPTYPLLAVIAGLWIADWIAAPELAIGKQWFLIGWWGLVAMGVGVMIALPIIVAHYAPGSPSSNWLGLILIAGGIAGWVYQRRGQLAFAASSLVVMGALLFTTMFAIAAPPISNQQTSVRLLEAVNRFGDHNTPIATYRIRLPDFIFYAGRTGPILGVRLANSSNPRDSVEWSHEFAGRGPENPYQPDDTKLWLDNLDGALLITDLEGLEQLRPILPADAVVLDREKRFLKPGELLLVGRRPKVVAAATANRATTERK